MQRNVTPQNTGISVRKPSPGSQVSHSESLVRGITGTQIQRIVAAIENGEPERKIAEREQVSEPTIRRIRCLHINRLHRRMSAVGTVFGGMLDNLRLVHGEIDHDAFDDLEGAA